MLRLRWHECRIYRNPLCQLDILTGLMTRGDEDLLTITFPKNKIEPVVLAVVHKLAKKQVQQAAPNLATYARVRESDRVCLDKLPVPPQRGTPALRCGEPRAWS